MNRKYFVVLIAFIFLGVPLFSIALAPVYAATTWAAPVNITNHPRPDFQSVITADTLEDRASHVAWVRDTVDGTTSWEIFYANSGDWSTHIPITNDMIKDYNPMIDMDNAGVVHVIWVKELTTGVSDIMYANSTNWGRHYNISRQEKGAWNHWPTLVVDKDTGTPHIAWAVGEQEPPGEIWYRKDIWGPIQQVTNTASWSYQPSIDLDQYKIVHVVWTELMGSDTAILYTNSTVWPANAAGNYLNVSDTIDNLDNDYRPDIAVDQQINRSHVTWWKDVAPPQVYWTISINNVLFLGPVDVSNPDMQCKRPSVKLSSLNNTAIIYEGYAQDWDILAVDYNSSWAAVDISTNSYADSLAMSSIGALDIDKYDTLYATYYTDIGAAASNKEVFVVDGNLSGAGIPGFGIVYLLIGFLSLLLVYYGMSRSRKALPK
jgi:hypothetical protein